MVGIRAKDGRGARVRRKLPLGFETIARLSKIAREVREQFQCNQGDTRTLPIRIQ
jgi:hypothetical protein